MHPRFHYEEKFYVKTLRLWDLFIYCCILTNKIGH